MKFTFFCHFGASLLAVSGLSLQPTTVWAQENASALEEVIVTARKREESLMETPVSISAFSGEALADMNLVQLDKVADQTPGLVFSNSANISGSANAAAVFIRGIGQNDFTLAVEPGVGIYIDDVYLPHSIGNVAALLDVERVEVLRGPQGTLFGRNTIGGAIRMVTNKPNEEFGGGIEFITGSYDRIDIKGHVNIPVSDRFFVRFAGASEDRDGFVERPFLDGESGDKDSSTLVGKARWLASDDFTVDIMVGYEKDDSDGAAAVALLQDPTHPAGTQPNNFRNFIAPALDPNVLMGMLQGFTPQAINDPDGDDFISFSNTDIPQTYESYSATVTLSWNISDTLSLKSISSWRNVDARFGRDADNLPFNQQVELFMGNDYDAWSQEIQLSGSSFNARLDWTVGGYYFYEDGVEDDFISFASFDINSGGFFETEDFAAFAQATWHATDKLALTGGLRYTDEEKKSTIDGKRHQALLTDIIGPNNPVPFKTQRAVPFALVGTGTFTDSLTETTPYANVAYQWTDSLMTYASYSEGFKGGGVQVRNGGLGFLPRFGPEFVDAYEVGLKWSGMDNRVNVSAAGYYAEYDDVQLAGIVFQPALGNAVSVVDNLGDAENQGFEIEIAALPTPNFHLTAGVAYLDSEYTRVKPNNPGDPLDPDSAITVDDELPNAPEWQFNLAAAYDINAAYGVFTPRVDLAYSDEQFNDAINSEILKRDSYTILNLSLGFVDREQRWSSALFVTNLLDEQFIQGGFNGFNYADGVISRPREWGFRIKRMF